MGAAVRPHTGGAWRWTAAVALRDELLSFDVGRTSGRAIADYRRARASLLLRFRLWLRRRHLPDAVKAPPGYADVRSPAIGDTVHEDHDDTPGRGRREGDECPEVVCGEVHLFFIGYIFRRAADDGQQKRKCFAKTVAWNFRTKISPFQTAPV